MAEPTAATMTEPAIRARLERMAQPFHVHAAGKPAIISALDQHAGELRDRIASTGVDLQDSEVRLAVLATVERVMQAVPVPRGGCACNGCLLARLEATVASFLTVLAP